LVDDHPDRFRLVSDLPTFQGHLAEWEAPHSEPPVGLVILMEGADGVQTPHELAEWHARGVRVLGPAWAGTVYAGGTGEPGPFTSAGRGLLREMAELNMVLDISHLADEAAQQALDSYPGPLIATHSNPRALMAGSRFPDRHLSDEVLKGLIERGGVVGIVLYNRFLKAGWTPAEGRQAVPLARVADHIDYVCQTAGSASHAGLGSDFDGGFGLEQVPEGLDTVADLRFIGDVLIARGYRPDEVEAILGGNWLNLLARVLPDL
jgi:membrane dipeptidase